MKRIVKPDILDEATSTTRLLAVKYKEPANCLRPQKFDVGYLAGASTKELLRKKEISKGALLRFRSIATSTTQASKQFKLVIDHLVKQQHLEGRSCDELIRQYDEFVDTVVKPNLPAYSASMSFCNSTL